MKIYSIYAHRIGDGMLRFLPYMGETEEIEKADYGGSGWHIVNHNTRNAIAFGRWGFDAPYEIAGTRNLKSHLERICTRLREGAFHDIDELKITWKEE